MSVFQDIERLAKLGLSVSPKSIQSKLLSWEVYLDKEIVEMKEAWEGGGDSKFQLVGDNWDKNILPSYRTVKDKTKSLHLFQLIAVPDRMKAGDSNEPSKKLSPVDFIPSEIEQKQFREELAFHIGTSIIRHVEPMTKVFDPVFPSHLEHEHSDLAGEKTKQVLEIYNLLLKIIPNMDAITLYYMSGVQDTEYRKVITGPRMHCTCL